MKYTFTGEASNEIVAEAVFYMLLQALKASNDKQVVVRADPYEAEKVISSGDGGASVVFQFLLTKNYLRGDNMTKRFTSVAELMQDLNSSKTDRCFCCGIEFTQAHTHGPKDYPSVLFQATGNFGSTIFDPSPTENIATLSVRICDGCVLERRDRIEEEYCSLPATLRDDVDAFVQGKRRLNAIEYTLELLSYDATIEVAAVVPHT